MTLDALEHRDVSQIDRMSKRLIWFMASLAFAICQPAKINRMLISAEFHRRCRVSRIVNHGVTDVAVLADDLARIAHMFTIVTTKTAAKI